MEDASEICCLCKLKLGRAGNNEVCFKGFNAHDACVELEYATYCGENGFSACSCGAKHRVTALIPRYRPSRHHAPWLRLFGYTSAEYVIIDDNVHGTLGEAMMHHPGLESVDSLRTTVNPAEFRLAAWSKNLMFIVFCLSIIGIVAMAFVGAIDWRMEIAYWTTLAVLFLLAAVLAPESASYFWHPGSTSTRPYARAYNKRMLQAHLAVFAVFALSYAIMMSLSSNNYSHIWNGVATFSVGIIVVYLLYKRYSYVSTSLQWSRFMWYSTAPPPKRTKRLSRSSSDEKPETKHNYTIDEQP